MMYVPICVTLARDIGSDGNPDGAVPVAHLRARGGE